MEEIAEHNRADDVWLVIDGKVYDVTQYVYLYSTEHGPAGKGGEFLGGHSVG